MSAIKKGIKKIGKFVKKHWKTIVLVAAVAFTAGLAVLPAGTFSAAIAGQGLSGLVSAVGSTMWAGATAIAGTVGIGPGASGTLAASSGMQGATLLTGSAAQSLGLAAAPVGPVAPGAAATGSVGTYTGPGSSFMGGKGSIFGGSAANAPASRAVESAATSAATQSATSAATQSATSAATQSAASEAAKQIVLNTAPSWKTAVASAAVPAAITMGGTYLMAKGQAEAAEPRQLYGIDLQTGENYLPSPLMGGPQTYQPGAPQVAYQPRQPMTYDPNFDPYALGAYQPPEPMGG